MLTYSHCLLKEDLELENEELASKLTDLTKQAKIMLLNNESLEEQIQDQQIEYEDRIAELESELAGKGEGNGEELLMLQQKHEKALETIVSLTKEIGQGKKDMNGNDERMKILEEENIELRQVIDHLAAENDVSLCAPPPFRIMIQ